MTDLSARTLSAAMLGVVGVFLVFVVGAGLATGGLIPAGSAAGGAAAPLGGGEQQSAAMADVGRGRQLFQQYGCAGCHSVNGQAGVGPTMKGLAGSQRRFTDGTTTVADDQYLKQAIQQPNARIVQGYAENIMLNVTKTYQADLDKDDVVNALIAYIKSVK